MPPLSSAQRKVVVTGPGTWVEKAKVILRLEHGGAVGFHDETPSYFCYAIYRDGEMVYEAGVQSDGRTFSLFPDVRFTSKYNVFSGDIGSNVLGYEL